MREATSERAKVGVTVSADARYGLGEGRDTFDAVACVGEDGSDRALDLGCRGVNRANVQPKANVRAGGVTEFDVWETGAGAKAIDGGTGEEAALVTGGVVNELGWVRNAKGEVVSVPPGEQG